MMFIMTTNSVRTPAIMGILNVTPDSFYDGGKFDAVDAAVAQAKKMIAEGANIIDIGGESTGPGSEDVSIKEELKRIIPVIEKMDQWINGSMDQCAISIDTYKAAVARAALEAGATMINDVTAGRGDPNMFRTIADAGCSYIMMHSKDETARTTIKNTTYKNIMQSIHNFFEERILAAVQSGIKRENIIIDPGLGHFVSSDPSYSWYVLEHLEELHDLGCQILVSPSRKSFTAAFPDQPASERLEGTLKATQIALEHGASIIRTHDVIATIDQLNKPTMD